jgi:hypothetical protein
MQVKVIVWSLAAAASLVVVAVWGLPRIAAELTPLIPHSVERKLGAAVERQVRANLDTHHTGAAFECGNGPKEKSGRAAFDKLMRQIETAADLPIPLSALSCGSRGECHYAPGRIHLRVPRPARQSGDAR